MRVLAFYSKSRCSFFPFYILRSTNFKTYIRGSPQILLSCLQLSNLFSELPEYNMVPLFCGSYISKIMIIIKERRKKKKWSRRRTADNKQMKKTGRKEGKVAEVRLH